MIDDFNLDRSLFKEFCPMHVCYAFVATAILGSAVVGGAVSAFAANKAANAQEQAAQTAANTSLSMYNQTNANLAPYRDLGSQASSDISSNLASLTAPITMDEATLEATPGYQFNLTQGLKAVQNSAVARGLGSSGAALKGAATFATGLADNTYQNQFNNAVTNQSNAFNRLSTLVNTGENAAAGTGAAGTAAAGQIGSAAIGAGNAAAAGANAIGTAATGVANAGTTAALFNGLYNNTAAAGTNPIVPGATNIVGVNGNNPVPTF